MNSSPEKPWRTWLVDVLLVLILSVAYVLLVVEYVSRERFFYFWDWGGYQWVALNYASKFLQAPLAVLTQIKDSIHLDYNHFYVLPLIPLLLAFGESRLSYILSVTLVYQLPFTLVASGITCKLVPSRPRAVFWSTAFVTLLMPVAMVPTLRAYPDVGAALLIGFAIWIYLQDTRMGKWWQLPLIGLFIAAAVLYRRHYAYGGLAFFAAISLQALIRFLTAMRADLGRAWRELLRSGLRLAVTGAITLLCLASLGRPLLLRMLTTNYGELYASYALPPGYVLNFYLSSYGWVVLCLMLAGFAIGTKKGVVEGSAAQMLALYGGITFLLWIMFVRQVSLHYSLHFTLFILLGLSAFVWTSWSILKDRARKWVVAGTFGYLAINAIIVTSAQPIDPLLQPLFSYQNPPLTRNDYDEVIRLVDYLRASLPVDNKIYVVDSSGRMNFDLLIKAEQELHPDQKLHVLVTPQIDSRDFYPLELLLEANYVIVSSPVQYHLANIEEQKVVAAAHQAFAEQWEIAQDFVRMPEQFELSDSVLLNIYQRRDQTSFVTAIKTYHRMRGIILRRPGNQPDWMELVPGQDAPLSKVGDRSWRLELTTSPEMPDEGYAMLFADEAPTSGRISGKWRVLDDARCPVLLGVQTLDAAGQAMSTDETSTTGKRTIFDLEFSAPGSGYLVFYIREQPGKTNDATCSIQLEWDLVE